MLRTRVATALLLLAGFLAALFLLPFAGWLLLVSAVCGLGAWEWGGLLKLGAGVRRGYALLLLVLCAVLGWLAFDFDSGSTRQPDLLLAAHLLSGAFWLLIVPLWLKTKWPIQADPAGLLSGAVVLLPACLAMMQLRSFAPLLLLAIMAAVWAADIAAYACGRAFGRRKLAPSVSPGKTWEGVAGALTGVLLYGLVLAAAADRVPGGWGAWLSILLASVLLTGVSILGDLFESLAKRQACVKDSGAALPGHGGMLDRIDSLTSTLPLAGLALLLWEGRMS